MSNSNILFTRGGLGVLAALAAAAFPCACSSYKCFVKNAFLYHWRGAKAAVLLRAEAELLQLKNAASKKGFSVSLEGCKGCSAPGSRGEIAALLRVRLSCRMQLDKALLICWYL